MRDEERQAFLAAIVASPDDDMPRLVYADFLEERGESDHSAFIRVQCELARIEHDGCTPVCSQECGHRTGCRSGEVTALRQRERELFQSVWPTATVSRNLGRLGDWIVMFPTLADWRRGFPAVWSCNWPFFLDAHAAILAACPIRGPNVGTQQKPRYEQPSRDGLVRLTTWPWIEYVSVRDNVVSCRLSINEPSFGPVQGPQIGGSRETALEMLAKEWRGVRFDLSRTQRDGFDFTNPVATPRSRAP